MSQIISKKLAIDVMNAALSTGADYAEIYAESSRPSSISIDNGKVDSISTPISEGAGIRLLKGVKSAYGYTSDLSRKNLLALAGKVAKSFEGERLFEVKEIKKERVKAISPIETHLNDVSAEEKIAYLKKAHEAASSVDPRIVRVTASFISKYKTTQTFVAENEIGHQYDNVEERGRVGIVCIAVNSNAVLRLNPLGDVLALLAALTWAFYSILTRKIGDYGYNTLQVTRRIFCWGLLFMLPVLPLADVRWQTARFADPVLLGNLLFLGLGASALCFATWNYSIKTLGAVKTSVYIYLVPVVAVITAMLVLHEPFTWLAALGMGLVLLGLGISECRISPQRLRGGRKA